jgi:hypothetical protein
MRYRDGLINFLPVDTGFRIVLEPVSIGSNYNTGAANLLTMRKNGEKVYFSQGKKIEEVRQREIERGKFILLEAALA